MPRIAIAALSGVILLGISAGDAKAQMFGNRKFGQSIQPQQNPGGGAFGTQGQPAPTGAPTVMGNVDGTSRFLRRNRSSADFVGQDLGEAQNIVGNVLAQGGPKSTIAAAEVRERVVPQVFLNPPRQPVPRTGMYEPKLSIDFSYAPRPDAEINADLQDRLARISGDSPDLRVSVEGRTARLEGVVPSERERRLIEQMMLFEPGISSVRNDLRVLADAPAN